MAAAVLLSALLGLTSVAQAAPGPRDRASIAPAARLPRPIPTAIPVLPFAERGRCEGLPAATAEVPYRPGEELSFELSVAGLYLGKLELKVGQPRLRQGKPVSTLFGRARTSGFASSLRSFVGRYMVLADPATLAPLELRTDTVYGGDPRPETTLFGADRFDTSFRADGRDLKRSYPLRMPSFDMLTLLYVARRLPALGTQAKGCHEIYADKRLWRVEAEFQGTETIRTAVGERRAHKVTSKWTRLPHPDFDPRRDPPVIELEAYFAADGAHVPLLFYARTKEVTAKAELTRWVTREGAGDAEWAL